MQLKLPLVPLATVSLMGLLTAHAPAQTKIYNCDNVASTGNCNAIPFGSTSPSTTWSNQKYQTIMPSSLFGKKTGMICSLGFANCKTGYQQFSSIEIKMDYFPGTGSTLTTTFANNITSKATTVLSAKNYVWHTKQNAWVNVGLQKPFLYIPQLGHLVVQITVMGATGTAGGFHRGGSPNPNVQRMYRTSWTGSPPPTGSFSSSAGLKMVIGFDAWGLDTYGAGCQGSNGKIPQLALTGSSALGQSVTLGLTDALPNANMFLIIGLTAPGTPVDMGMYGAPSCTLYPALDIIVPTKANASGAFSQKFPMPTSSSMVCSKAYMQFFPHDKNANAFGASSSFYGRVLIGR
ncbi:MAG: hypothetical protein ACYTKC_02210 [Planctomycetota bacterium]|jgi:hypothetical protein